MGTHPVEESYLHETNAELVFAFQSQRWRGRGVAFLKWTEGVQPAEPNVLRLYKIFRSQFEDLHAQECNVEGHLDLPLLLPGRGEIHDSSDRTYGRLLGLGDHSDGVPIVTITSARDDAEPNPPSVQYALTVAQGLMETMGWDLARASAHLATKPGLRETFTPAALADWLDEHRHDSE